MHNARRQLGEIPDAQQPTMERYGNLSGDSGVVAYEIGRGSITVEFREGHVYRYTNTSAGSGNIAEMQRLARTGRGLSGFISRVVRDRYAAKLR